MPITKGLRDAIQPNANGKPPGDPLFSRKAKHGLRNAIHTLARRYALPPIHPHQIRHAWADETLKRTGDIRAVMDLGGWKKLTTMQRYLSSDLERKRRVIESLGF